MLDEREENIPRHIEQQLELSEEIPVDKKSNGTDRHDNHR